MNSHSHVHGLSNGIVGHDEVRRSLDILATQIRSQRMNGRTVLLHGPQCAGKNALATALRLEIGSIPFVHLTASELRTDPAHVRSLLHENVRRAVLVTINENRKVFEGELVRFETEHEEKNLKVLRVQLRSSKGTKELSLDPLMYDDFISQRIRTGDVIHIDVSSFSMVRLGRCETHSTECDVESVQYCKLPLDVERTREVTHTITLHDLDTAHATPDSRRDVFSLLAKQQRAEPTTRLRSEVDMIVKKYIEEDIATVSCGILFIDEAHLLTETMFSVLADSLRDVYSPMLLLATNRGDDFKLPKCVLGALKIKVRPLNEEEVAEVLRLRGGASASNELIKYLVDTSKKTDLRYALRLMALAIAGSMDIHKVKELRRSVRHYKDFSK